MLFLKYQLDDSANVTRVIDYRQAGQRHCFDYDDAGRLTAAFTGNDACTAVDAARGDGEYGLAYTYTASGNLRHRVDTVASTNWWYTYPSGTHQVTTAGPHSFAYDGNGAMVSRTISGVIQTLDYDRAHRLTGIAGGGDTTGFLYDADGNRVRSSSNGTHTFQWGDWTWIDGDTDPQVVYRLAGALVAARDGDGKLWWSIDDHLSSTTVQYHAGTDTVRHQRYLPFGKVRIDDGTVTDVGYTGQRLDATGLMFYQARYYDPLIGRFTSADTIVPDPTNPQDLNRYTYVNNNPLKYTDPTGHCTTVTADGVCVIYSNGATWRLGPNGTTVTALTVDAQNHMESLDGFASSCDWTSCTYSQSNDAAPLFHALPRFVADIGKDVAVAASAVAAVSACGASAGVGCLVFGALIVPAAVNVIGDEGLDCLYGDCLSFSPREQSLQLAGGALMGVPAAGLARHVAKYAGHFKPAIGLVGLALDSQYGPKVAIEIGLVQWFPRVERLLFNFLFKRLSNQLSQEPL